MSLNLNAAKLCRFVWEKVCSG